MTRRPILLVVNPQAGRKPVAGPRLADDPDMLAADALAARLEERGLTVSHRELAESDDLVALATTAADTGHDVVVVGGDGTVSLAAAALIGHPEASLGVLAAGTFNNMARGFGIPPTLDEALDVIVAGETARVDAGWVVRDAPDAARPFFEAAGVGLDAVGFMAVKIAERRGWLRGLRAMVRGVRFRRTPMRITIDGAAYRTGTPAVVVSNGPYHGMGFAVSPDADPTDGALDVVVFRGMGRWEVLAHFFRIAFRRPRREPRVRLYRGRRVTIEGLRRSLPAHADGDAIGLTPVTFEVRPAALRIFR
jgi:YegS/Rv2252/BmrU family lipid kinase